MFNNKFQELIEIKKPIIWINTLQEKEVFLALKNEIDKLEDIEKIYTWSYFKGLCEINKENNLLEENTVGNNTVNTLINKMFEEDTTNELELCAFILKDFHLISTNPGAIRGLRDVLEKRRNKYNPIIVLSPSIEVPFELEKLTAIINYDDPTEEEILKLLNVYENSHSIELEDKSHLSKLFVGFSRREIIDTLTLSLSKNGYVDINDIAKKKIEVIKESGVLDYKEPKVTFDEVGGNNFFKKWIEELEYCMMDDAIEYGVQRPKGHLALGIPGTSKTFTAEALAGKWKVPFLKLSMDKILSKYAGESERNIAKALTLITSCAPCVLLIDEVEKALGGIKSSNASDSGVIARAFGKVLEFLNDNDNGVYTIMTSNDVSQLPPELTRAGRLDAIWYFGLPDEDERKEIFKVHFAKTKQHVDNDLIEVAVNETNKYTGAEIEQIVKASVKKAFIRMKKENTSMKITKSDIIEAKEQVIPISKSSKEKIAQLELWANGRALYANKKKKKVKINLDTEIF